MGVLGAKLERGGAMFTTNKLVFTFGGFYVCANFSENPSTNANMSARRRTHGQRQTAFIIYPMLYAIAMRQIINLNS